MPFDTTSGQDIDNVVITFTTDTTEVAGTVTPMPGAPKELALVIAFPADRAQWTDYGLSDVPDDQRDGFDGERVHVQQPSRRAIFARRASTSRTRVTGATRRFSRRSRLRDGRVHRLARQADRQPPGAGHPMTRDRSPLFARVRRGRRASASRATDHPTGRRWRPPPCPWAPERLSGQVVTFDEPRAPVGRAIVTVSGDQTRARSVIANDDGTFVVDGLPDARLTSKRRGRVSWRAPSVLDSRCVRHARDDRRRRAPRRPHNSSRAGRRDHRDGPGRVRSACGGPGRDGLTNRRSRGHDGAAQQRRGCNRRHDRRPRRCIGSSASRPAITTSLSARAGSARTTCKRDPPRRSTRSSLSCGAARIDRSRRRARAVTQEPVPATPALRARSAEDDGRVCARVLSGHAHRGGRRQHHGFRRRGTRGCRSARSL